MSSWVLQGGPLEKFFQAKESSVPDLIKLYEGKKDSILDGARSKVSPQTNEKQKKQATNSSGPVATLIKQFSHDKSSENISQPDSLEESIFKSLMELHTLLSEKLFEQEFVISTGVSLEAMVYKIEIRKDAKSKANNFIEDCLKDKENKKQHLMSLIQMIELSDVPILSEERSFYPDLEVGESIIQTATILVRQNGKTYLLTCNHGKDLSNETVKTEVNLGPSSGVGLATSENLWLQILPFGKNNATTRWSQYEVSAFELTKESADLLLSQKKPPMIKSVFRGTPEELFALQDKMVQKWGAGSGYTEGKLVEICKNTKYYNNKGKQIPLKDMLVFSSGHKSPGQVPEKVFTEVIADKTEYDKEMAKYFTSPGDSGAAITTRPNASSTNVEAIGMHLYGYYEKMEHNYEKRSLSNLLCRVVDGIKFEKGEVEILESPLECYLKEQNL